ncbi:MAG: 3-dehydroquinate synthase [Thermoplasmata archaeon]|jgi:3-dehydroquinate synthase II|nr:3-dehydroquinate synthase [Thermoplasmata archaeon]
MKRVLWIDLRHVPVHKRLGHLRTLADSGAAAVLLEKGDAHHGREGLAAITVDAKGGLRQGGKPVGRVVRVHDKASQARAAKAKGILVAKPDATAWKVIPLENLLAARAGAPVYAWTQDPKDIPMLLTVLERGVDGIVLAPESPMDILECRAAMAHVPHQARPAAAAANPPPVLPAQAPPAPQQLVVTGPLRSLHEGAPRPDLEMPTALAFEPARVTRIERVGVAERVCVDATARFEADEGLLVGSTAKSFCLVLSETAQSDLVPARPFRVNAGAVHSYLLAPGGRTSYLTELAAGSPVLAATAAGRTRELVVGRAKIEPRPHLLLAWQGPSGAGSVVLQEAETVRVATPNGPRAVTQLRVGDAILAHPESAGRHTGLPVGGSLEER